MTRADLRRQLALHLAGWQAAGVQFLPRPARPAAPDPAPPAAVPRLTAAPTSARRPTTEVAPVAPPPPVVVDPLADRRKELAVLAAEVAGCRKCPELFASRTQTVFGVGPPDPDVCFVGEAPGADEDAQGVPFVGRAGQLLTRIITACGFTRDQVYICNILKCRPPGNRTPSAAECDHCLPYLERQIAAIKPRFLVALGGTAAKALLNTPVGITRLRGVVHKYADIPLICTFHPSAVLRDETGARKRDCWDDMKLLLGVMGRPVPGANK